MRIVDTVLLGDARVSPEGYLEANARTARTGIQQYLGREVGRPDIPVVNVYRSEDEVFSTSSLQTFSKIPMTNDHPSVAVNAENWRDLAVGVTGDEVLRDGQFLKIGLKITDAGAVKDIRDGKRELSVGYDTVLIWEDGVAPDGTPYQAKQTQISANHIAIVRQGRAGAEVRIGDADAWGVSPVKTGDANPIHQEKRAMTTRTIMVDGLAVELTDRDAQIVQRTIDNMTKASDEAKAAHAAAVKAADEAHSAAIAAKDAELAKKDATLAAKDAEIDSLKTKVLTDAALDQRVAERSALLAAAKAIAPTAKLDNLSDADIRKAAVVAALGATMADKAPAYIDVRFDMLVEDAQKDPIRRAHFNAPVADASAGARPGVNPAQLAMVSGMTDAWKTQGTK